MVNRDRQEKKGGEQRHIEKRRRVVNRDRQEKKGG